MLTKYITFVNKVINILIIIIKMGDFKMPKDKKEQQAKSFAEIWQAAQSEHELIMQHPYIQRKQI